MSHCSEELQGQVQLRTKIESQCVFGQPFSEHCEGFAKNPLYTTYEEIIMIHYSFSQGLSGSHRIGPSPEKVGHESFISHLTLEFQRARAVR